MTGLYTGKTVNFLCVCTTSYTNMCTMDFRLRLLLGLPRETEPIGCLSINLPNYLPVNQLSIYLTYLSINHRSISKEIY